MKVNIDVCMDIEMTDDVPDPTDTDPLESRMRESAVEAVKNALAKAEANGFAHDMDSVSLVAVTDVKLSVLQPVVLQDTASDAVNHPSHYGGKDNPYEAIKVIEACELNFHLGNTVKYILRADKKGRRLEDLKKAVWYLQREIDRTDPTRKG